MFPHKKDSKSKYDDNHSLRKYNEISRIHELQKNAVFLKKSIRARVTSTSFYHAKDR